MKKKDKKTSKKNLNFGTATAAFAAATACLRASGVERTEGRGLGERARGVRHKWQMWVKVFE